MSSNEMPGDKGKRSRGDRRRYSYDAHIPERRNGEERRGEPDRRRAQRAKK